MWEFVGAFVAALALSPIALAFGILIARWVWGLAAEAEREVGK